MPGKIQGKVVAVTDSGDLVTDISCDRLSDAPRDERVSVTCDEHVTQGLYEPGHGEPAMTFLAILGASGKLELTIVGDSAAIMLGVRPGESVVVQWT